MGSFEEEWAQLKRDAVAMRLASASPGNAGAADIKTTQSAWTAVGNSVGELVGDVQQALGMLDQGQHGLAAGGGVDSAAAQADVYGSWKTYLDMLSGRCDKLRGALGRAGNDLFLTDKGVLDLFAALHVQEQDTPAVGGSGR